MHSHPISTAHIELQPSPKALLPSSHVHRAFSQDGGTTWNQGYYEQSFALYDAPEDCLTTTTSTSTKIPEEILCGDVGGSRSVTAGDALSVLMGAVGAMACPACERDVNNSGSITAGDALAILNAAVGLPIVLECPACV